MTNTPIWMRPSRRPGEPARLGVAADREHVPPHHRPRAGRSAPSDGHRQHHQHRHRIQRLAEPERRLGDRRQRRRQPGCSRRCCATNAMPAQDPHRPERDDERVDAEADDHQAVDDAAERGRRRAQIGEPDAPRSAPAPSGPAARSTIAVVTPGERVDRPDREVDPARDDHDRGADGHDREEAGVGRGLDQRVRVEEVVDRSRR